MIQTTFEFEAAGAPVDSSPRWSVPSGGTNSMVFSTPGVLQTSGTSYVQSTTAPTRANQSVEIGFTWYSTDPSIPTPPSPGTEWTGLFLRWVDANNHVMAVVDHGTQQCSIVETVSGSPSTLLTVNPSTIIGDAAVKVELIGSRCRVWFEGNEFVQDRPPDGACNLAGDPTILGNWGMYMSGGDSNGTMRILSFRAAVLPSSVMSAPAFTATDATGLNLIPVTLTLNNGAGGQTEWQILPADWADMPEPFSVITAATSLVAWVRPGYNYDARCRDVYGNAPGPWTDPVRFSYGTATAAGSETQEAFQGLETEPFVPPALYSSQQYQESYWPTELYGAGNTTYLGTDNTTGPHWSGKYGSAGNEFDGATGFPTFINFDTLVTPGASLGADGPPNGVIDGSPGSGVTQPQTFLGTSSLPITLQIDDISPGKVTLAVNCSTGVAESFPVTVTKVSDGTVLWAGSWSMVSGTPSYIQFYFAESIKISIAANPSTGDPAEIQGILYDPASGGGGVTGVASATETFPSIVPEYILDSTAEAGSTPFVSNVGTQRVVSSQLRPRYSFVFKFTSRTSDEYQTLIDFFEFAQSQNLPWNWTHPLTGVSWILRFATDDYEAEYKDHGPSSPIVSLSFKVTEAPVGVVASSLAVRLLADSSLI